MGKKTKVDAPKPDPAIGEAAMLQGKLGMEYLEVAKGQFAEQMKRQDKTDAITERVANSQLAAQDQASKWATEDRNRYKSVFQPMQDEFIKTAKEWDSPERQDKMAAEARADVLNNAAATQGARGRSMAAMGVNPASGRYAGVERSADAATALSAAGAENTARNTSRNQALALKSDAINMGNGLPSQAAGSLGLGVSAGGAAVGSNAAGNAAALQAGGVLQGGYQTAMAGQQSKAGILNQQYGQQINAWSTQQQAASQNSAGMWGGIGSMVGMAAMFSSEDYKEDKKPVSGARDALDSMPVEEWKYKDGIADGGKHIGPYAEDFHAATGKGDGKTIPFQDAIGITMGAVQELSKELREMKGQAKQGSSGKAADTAGMIEPGNIDLDKRPVVDNADGSISTVRSMSVNFDGKEYLIPTVANDGSRVLSDEEAIKQFEKTGEHLGVFETPDAATSYADQLHVQQERQYAPKSKPSRAPGRGLPPYRGASRPAA